MLVTIILLAIVTSQAVRRADYNQQCETNEDCEGNALICSPSKQCDCSDGYEYSSYDYGCQASSTKVVQVNYLTFPYRSIFPTNMRESDLNADRIAEMKSDLKPQLTEFFKNVSGFICVEVTDILLEENYGILEVTWLVKLDRNDPDFAGMNSTEIGEVLRPQLETLSGKYKDSLRLNTMKKTSENSSLALGLGIGLGVGIPVLIGIVLVVVFVLLRNKRHEVEKKSTSSKTTSSRTDGGSTYIDPVEYRYDTVGKDNDSMPPIYETIYPPSVTGSSVSASTGRGNKIPL